MTSIQTALASSDYNLEEFAVKDKEEDFIAEPELKPTSQFEINKDALKPTIENASEIQLEPSLKQTPFTVEPSKENFLSQTHEEVFVIEKAQEEDIVEENLASRLVADFGLFDPTLDLSNYKFPSLDLLKEYSTGGITINQSEFCLLYTSRCV